VKVWLHAVERPQFTEFTAAQLLVGVRESINIRIERLLTSPESIPGAQRSRRAALGVSTSTFIALVIVQGANLIIILTLMGCNPVALLERLF